MNMDFAQQIIKKPQNTKENSLIVVILIFSRQNLLLVNMKKNIKLILIR